MKTVLIVLMALCSFIIRSEKHPANDRYAGEGLLDDYPSIYKKTPLMQAVINQDIEHIKQLIKAGEDVNAVAYRDWPHGGKPVLRYAIDTHSWEIVRILLEAHANPNNFTESPLISENRTSNVRNISLLSHAINSHAPLTIITELITFGAHLDGSPKICGDWSALMIAAYRGYTEAVILLLDKGADILAINSTDGKTALDYAKEQKHTDIIEILVTRIKHLA